MFFLFLKPDGRVIEFNCGIDQYHFSGVQIVRKWCELWIHVWIMGKTSEEVEG